MRNRLLIALGTVGLAALAPAASVNNEVPLEVVHFELSFPDMNDAIYVLGDLPELGDDNMTRAIKLVSGPLVPGSPATRVWEIDIAVPQGVEFTYSFVRRDDAISAQSNPANGAAVSGPFTLQTTTPTPERVQLRFFRQTGAPGDTITFNTDAGPLVRDLEPVPGFAELLVATLDDQPFGRGIDAIVNNKAIVTPLHTVLRRGAQHYNYLSDPAASRDGRRELFTVPTGGLIPSTRTINGVTGRGIEVWLPRGYDAETSRRYPVLYMHDGQNVFTPGGAFGTWAAELVAGGLIQDARIRELIIVAIDNSSNRLAEYNPEWSGSDNVDYNTFVVNVLKPAIDARYRTLTDRPNTGIMGSSFGGVASLSLAVNYPNVFGRVGALSTSFWATTLENVVPTAVLPATRLYIDVGDQNDGGDNAVAARDQWLGAGRVLEQNLFFQIGFGQAHNESAWNARLPFALEALFPITDEANTIDLPVPQLGDVTADGCVDLDDLLIVLSSFEAGSAGDADADGDTDLNDLLIVLAAFGAGCS
jgi:predicted alpha/beta superfamily hydrolase